MRIILTEKGESQFPLTEASDTYKARIQKKLNTSRQTLMNGKKDKRKLPSSRSLQSLEESKDLFKNSSFSKLHPIQPTVISHKAVNVHVKKLSVNKHEQDKYNEGQNLKPNLISHDLPVTINNKNINSLKVTEILKPAAVDKLKEAFERHEHVKSNLNRVDEQHFRSVFEPSNKNKFKSQLEKEIERDKVNLIKYLHSKDQVSLKLIEKLSGLNESKLTKMNRICNIYFHYENFDKKTKEKIKEKLKEADNAKKQDIQHNVDSIGESIKEGLKLLSKYKNKSTVNTKAYENLHQMFKLQHWNKLTNCRIYQGVNPGEDSQY